MVVSNDRRLHRLFPARVLCLPMRNDTRPNQLQQHKGITMNLTERLPNFDARHYLNKGDALTRTINE